MLPVGQQRLIMDDVLAALLACVGWLAVHVVSVPGLMVRFPASKSFSSQPHAPC